MSQSAARVENVDALRAFKTSLWKFAEAANTALTESDSEIQRTVVWLETEQRQHWETQVRKCQEAVVRAKDALRQKKLYKDSSGRTPSAVDEEKALRVAVRRLEEAELRAANTKRHARQLAKEYVLYKGQVQRFATSVMSDLPVAVSDLGKMVEKIEAYLALNMQTGGPPPMAASESAEPPPAPEPTAQPAVESISLRLRTPIESSRAAAEILADRVAWIVGEITAAQLKALAAANVPQSPVKEALRVTIGEGAWKASRVYLHRATPAGGEDSGWYIGPADDTLVGPPKWLRVVDILELRPDWTELLALPQDFVAVLGAAGLAAVYAADDRDILRAGE